MLVIHHNDADGICAAICKKHGGGGHKGAAGFVCAELPFKKATVKDGVK